MCFCLYFVLHFASLIYASPIRLMPLNSHIDLVENMSYPITCAVLSGSQISFDWNHNGITLTNSSDIHIENTAKFSLLTFKNVKRQHSGIYECQASNSFGQSDQTKTQINVQGKTFALILIFRQ